MSDYEDDFEDYQDDFEPESPTKKAPAKSSINPTGDAKPSKQSKSVSSLNKTISNVPIVEIESAAAQKEQIVMKASEKPSKSERKSSKASKQLPSNPNHNDTRVKADETSINQNRINQESEGEHIVASRMPKRVKKFSPMDLSM